MSTSSLEELKDDELSPTDELHRVSKKSNPDGTLDVDIFDWRKEGDNVIVEFITPACELEEEEMVWPKRDDPEEYKFSRICHEYGSGIIDPDSIKGAEVPAYDENWELHVEYEPGCLKRLKQIVFSQKIIDGTVLLGGVGVVVGFYGTIASIALASMIGGVMKNVLLGLIITFIVGSVITILLSEKSDAISGKTL